MFVCPGREAPAPMKYPVAGTDNHTSQLRLIIIDGNTVSCFFWASYAVQTFTAENARCFEVLDCGLKVPLKMRYPWVEYIARAGFLNDGKTWVQHCKNSKIFNEIATSDNIRIWVQIMNRTQSQAALVILPESEFEGISSSGPIREACIVKDEVSTAWINVGLRIF